MARKTNTPYTLGTSSRTRNIIVAIVIVALIGAGVFYALHRETPNSSPAESVELPEIVVQSDSVSVNTPQKACEAINAYYTALASGNAVELAAMGNSAASAAVQAGWLKAMDYSVDSSKAATASRNDFPVPAGMWAGNILYNIGEFYQTYPEGSIRNNVTGTSGPSGWIYLDTTQGRWMIADPTIPTATNSAQSNTVEKASSDKLVTVKAQSVGALANPWWCVAQVGLTISSTNKNSEVFLTPREFDEGITLNIPPNLAQPVPRAQEVPVAPQVEQVLPADSPEAANVSTEVVTTLVPQKLTGVCIIYRGTLSEFAINKIGSPPLTLEGDIMPLDISTSEENITPIFPIGDSTLEEILKTMTQEEIDRYNATDAELPGIPKIKISKPEESDG